MASDFLAISPTYIASVPASIRKRRQCVIAFLNEEYRLRRGVMPRVIAALQDLDGVTRTKNAIASDVQLYRDAYRYLTTDDADEMDELVRRTDARQPSTFGIRCLVADDITTWEQVLERMEAHARTDNDVPISTGISSPEAPATLASASRPSAPEVIASVPEPVPSAVVAPQQEPDPPPPEPTALPLDAMSTFDPPPSGMPETGTYHDRPVRIGYDAAFRRALALQQNGLHTHVREAVAMIAGGHIMHERLRTTPAPRDLMMTNRYPSGTRQSRAGERHLIIWQYDTDHGELWFLDIVERRHARVAVQPML